MIRLLTFIFTFNAIFLSMDGVCLCEMDKDSGHSMVQTSIADTEKLHETADPDDCCDTSVCPDNCMSTLSLLTSNKQKVFISRPAKYPEHIYSHFYQLYLSVSSPPPLV